MKPKAKVGNISFHTVNPLTSSFNLFQKSRYKFPHEPDPNASTKYELVENVDKFIKLKKAPMKPKAKVGNISFHTVNPLTSSFNLFQKSRYKFRSCRVCRGKSNICRLRGKPGHLPLFQIQSTMAKKEKTNEIQSTTVKKGKTNEIQSTTAKKGKTNGKYYCGICNISFCKQWYLDQHSRTRKHQKNVRKFRSTKRMTDEAFLRLVSKRNDSTTGRKLTVEEKEIFQKENLERKEKSKKQNERKEKEKRPYRKEYMRKYMRKYRESKEEKTVALGLLQLKNAEKKVPPKEKRIGVSTISERKAVRYHAKRVFAKETKYPSGKSENDNDDEYLKCVYGTCKYNNPNFTTEHELHFTNRAKHQIFGKQFKKQFQVRLTRWKKEQEAKKHYETLKNLTWKCLLTRWKKEQDETLKNLTWNCLLTRWKKEQEAKKVGLESSKKYTKKKDAKNKSRICHICNKQYAGASGLWYHMKNTHGVKTMKYTKKPNLNQYFFLPKKKRTKSNSRANTEEQRSDLTQQTKSKDDLLNNLIQFRDKNRQRKHVLFNVNDRIKQLRKTPNIDLTVDEKSV